MKDKKTRQEGSQQGTTSTQNEFGYMTPPDTPDVQAAREWQPQVDPGIGFQFARARQSLRNQFNNPLGADTPAAVRDAAIYAGEGDLMQQEGNAYRQAYNDVNQQEGQKRQFLAGLTRPELVGKGTTSTTSGTSKGVNIEPGGAGGLLGGLANVGLAFA